ncbi:MAG: hypothetical protein M1365_16360, partial [Actinobacteria bacterium]|nr:hypothetical protein [Actinomycetota bacterium]
MKVESESIAIVTTTFYPHWYPGQFLTESGTDKQTDIEKVRGDLALKTITLAKDKGFQVVVINGANNQAFTDQLSQIGINLYPEAERGMSVSRQQGFKIACNLDRVEVICWLEPEKVSLVADCLPQAVMPIL